MEGNRWRQALARTRRTAFGRLASLVGATDLSSAFWEGLEETLVQADLGIKIAQTLITDLKEISRAEGLTRGDQILERLHTLLLRSLEMVPNPEPEMRPLVIILVGVNGSGKTTSAARIAHRWLSSGDKVMLAAADTYRAAASEQLEIWGDRLGVEVITGQSGSDPGAVVYNAAQATLARDVDVLIVDTSGRMHTEHNLMAELQKICRVAGKVIPGAPHQVLLVLDATTGQNGLAQAQAFTDAVDVTGVIVAKLDSSARGGVGFAINSVLGLPIQYVGFGETLEDLSAFDAEAFVDGLLAESETVPRHEFPAPNPHSINSNS
ncbi:MAG TPA: signal recognition particle-docking protein FtsY [Anaerolineae bacterium]|nr:signal recognition particle-docking protein FtsY [Anaerolineae bacterium]